jgi:hypothetical protein
VGVCGDVLFSSNLARIATGFSVFLAHGTTFFPSSWHMAQTFSVFLAHDKNFSVLLAHGTKFRLLMGMFQVQNRTAVKWHGIGSCHTPVKSSLGQSSFYLFIALRTEAFMSSGYELFNVGLLVNLKLTDEEVEYHGPIWGTLTGFI